MSVVKTPWLVAIAVAVVVGIGAVVYVDETNRSEAALGDLGAAQLEIASALASDAVRAPGTVVLREPTGVLADAVARGETIVRLSRPEAAKLGLPERAAMAGIARSADGKPIVVVTTAERQRDRDRAGLYHVLGAMLLAAAVMSAVTVIAWRQQRAESDLAHEAELTKLQRAATMAALGSGVAHELGTPLGVIVGRAEQIAARGDEKLQKHAQIILDQAEHIDRVVRGFLGLARGAPVELQPTTARTLVGEAAALVEHRFQRADVHLIPAVETEVAVRCEPLLFKHALVNLMLNACDAAPAKSHVRVEVTADANEVAFTVTDEGEGISTDAAARATEPFFTTKSHGTGLGLAIASEIAKTHRGSLEIAAIQPRGTRASIRIPAS